MSPARALAADVLVRVWEEDAFAAAALNAELERRPQLDPRDVGLATELTYGVLRAEAYLDEKMAALASRKIYAPEPRVRAHLLMGAYALLFLDRVPAFAAVSEAVEGVREATDDRVAGFANAVLRKVGAEVEAKGRPALADAVAASAPGWLRGALRRTLGRAGATAYLAAGPVPPPIGLALAKGEDREAWLEQLRAAAPNASFEAGTVSPRAIVVRGAGDVRRLPGAGTAWIVQEEGAQTVALCAGARPGDRVLDACAGRGNKSWLLAAEVGNDGAVDAADLHPAKLEKLREGPVGALVRETYPVDWSLGPGDVPEGYDVVIVDAPCSGTGTLRRRPEIGRKREEGDLARLAELQTMIARRAATRVKTGGHLVFAVCSVLKEEGEEVVQKLVSLGGDDGVKLAPAPFEDELGKALSKGTHMARVLPHEHGTDGYFFARLAVTR